MTDLAALTAAIEAGDRDAAARITSDAIDDGLDPQTILDAMTAAMAVIGARFSSGEIFVPEMLISARAMKAAMALLEPGLAGAGVKPVATAVIGTVQGDLHDIGKSLVAMMWRGANIAVVDLGVNVPAKAFLEAIDEHKAAIVGLSALLTTTMPAMRATVAEIKASGLPVIIVVGGAPVTPEFALEIGADAFGQDAGTAADLVLDLVGAPG
jgi:5-methyltetrahydrofolate--homocysteine methyltransferase